MSNVLEKQQQRRVMRNILLALPKESKIKKSAVLVALLQQYCEARSVHTIALFVPFSSEPDITIFTQRCLAIGIRIVVPHTDLEKYIFVPLQGKDDTNSVGEKYLPIDTVFIPGLAFTKEGKRLGRGGGWYDRTISVYKSHYPTISLVGICFSEQIVDDISHESHDQLMDKVIYA